jgi:hypothetical protein
MGISASTLALMASAGATAGGAYLNHQQQKSSMKDYNNQVTRQNQMLTDQFAEKQRKINDAKTQQGKVFNDIATQQNDEYAKQVEFAKQKAQLFQDMAAKPVIQAAASPEYQDAVASREQLFTDGGALPGSFDVGGGTQDKVLREAEANIGGAEKARTKGITGAQAKIGALSDVAGTQNRLFQDVGVKMGDIATDANRSTNMLSGSLRLPEYRMAALGAAAGEEANTPYFRGQEPVYRTPNTLFADLLGGAGQLGLSAALKQPAAAKKNIWTNPDTLQKHVIQ